MKNKLFYERFPHIKEIVTNDNNIKNFVDDYANDKISLDECIQMIIFNQSLRLESFQDMFTNS